MRTDATKLIVAFNIFRNPFRSPVWQIGNKLCVNGLRLRKFAQLSIR
jgi:hypothetical protein